MLVCLCVRVALCAGLCLCVCVCVFARVCLCLSSVVFACLWFGVAAFLCCFVVEFCVVYLGVRD